MEMIFQLWGGIFYLLAKILLSIPKNKNGKFNYSFYGWLVYLLGIPAWIIVLMIDGRYMAMAIEAGGAPSIVVGLINSFLKKKIPNSINILTKLVTLLLIISGVLYSFYINSGIRTFPQILEICIMIGFLMGTYLLSQGNRNGWLYFIIMNLSMAILMSISSSNRNIFIIMQLISIIFDVRGFIKKNY